MRYDRILRNAGNSKYKKTTKRKLPTPREKEQTKNWNETKQDKRHKNRKIIKLRTFKKK